jgi:hypothetical protein
MIDFSPISLLERMLKILVDKDVSKSYTFPMYFELIPLKRPPQSPLTLSLVFYQTLVLESADFNIIGIINSSKEVKR